MPIKEVLPDGTRVYTKGHRYKPLADHERKIRRNKPDNAEARGFVRWRGDWLPPLPLLPEDKRAMPMTVSEWDLADHVIGCECLPCRDNPYALERKRRRIYGKHYATKFRSS